MTMNSKTKEGIQTLVPQEEKARNGLLWLDFTPRLHLLKFNPHFEELTKWKLNPAKQFRSEVSGKRLGLNKVIRVAP